MIMVKRKGNKMHTFAGIVLFNPEIERLKENLQAIVPQVAEVVLIDNCSQNIAEIKNLLRQFQTCKLVENNENKGIATALNQILGYAAANDYEWFLTLDQDSVCSERLIETYEKFVSFEKIGMVTSLVVDRNYTGSMSFIGNEEYHYVTYCITSGALVNTKACRECGGWDDVLFIDNVDGEICIHLKKLGYKVLSVKFNGILHEIGHGRDVKFLWKKDVVYNHPAFRQYYMARNRVYVARKYPEEFILRKELLKELRNYRLILFFEKNKFEKMRARIKGVKDGFKLKITDQ